ncbi:MAG: hypothetical protein A4E54_01791 [Pelotomaculum sp. PtaB.Bin117]|nr:MAG: hypothetical protein A4E54_01791 [Pelotomaculum sp. PtaB.Bin117]OPY62232.1 MAG: hypothetical protein A4E56_01489 [Pelotomaculum sp. PtaU1.Bin065]
MKRQELDMLDDEKTLWICVGPIIRKVRGKDLGKKSQAIMQLNNGQRALFLFQVLYGHANNGIAHFLIRFLIWRIGWTYGRPLNISI